MDKQAILSIDQSTSGTKALLIRSDGEIIHRASKDHAQIYPRPGWVEHDPMEIYGNVAALIRETVEASPISLGEIAALSITNQRETIVVWDKRTGLPVYNAIVWQCRRTADMCRELREDGLEELVRERTGLTVDPYFSATKAKWILDQVDGAREKAAAGHLLLGTIDSWLLWKLTDGRVHATDYTNASRTMLFDIYGLEWDRYLLDVFDIPAGMLPQVKFSDELFGQCTAVEGMALPIRGVAGDSHGALIGQMCFEAGMVKATFGTGSSLMMNTGLEPVEADNGLMTTIAYAFGGKVRYALEGIVNSTGDTLKWMKDNLGLFDSFREAEAMASSLPDNEGVYIVPSFSGLGAPHWDPFVRASINGMTRGTNKNHIVRAGMESIVYQIKDVVDLMRDRAGAAVKELRVDGGPTSNRFLMQFLADILGVKVVRTNVSELSAMGASYAGGLGTGLWKDAEEIKALQYERYDYERTMTEELCERYCREWRAVIDLHTARSRRSSLQHKRRMKRCQKQQ